MIDTMVLTIPIKKGMIRRPEWFKPPLNIYKTTPARICEAFIKATQNPSLKDLRNGIYKPRLTFMGRPSFKRRYDKEYVLRIEFSAPKLLYGNNFDELEDSDFPKVIAALEAKLKLMEVYISTKELMDATVSAIHYSKNIIMTDGTTVTMILDELGKVDLNGHLDLAKTDFRTGHAIRYHADSFEVVFYDKIEELRKAKISSKRPLEKDSPIQLNLFEPLQNAHLEVLRMEVRLGKKRKIEQILKKIGSQVTPTFKNLFSKDISQKVLLSYWNEIDQNIFYRPNIGKRAVDLANAVKQMNQHIGLDKTLKMVGLLMLIEELGLPQCRSYFGLVGNKASQWYRLKKELKAFSASQSSLSYTSLTHIPNALSAFQATKLANYNIKI